MGPANLKNDNLLIISAFRLGEMLGPQKRWKEGRLRRASGGVLLSSLPTLRPSASTWQPSENKSGLFVALQPPGAAEGKQKRPFLSLYIHLAAERELPHVCNRASLTRTLSDAYCATGNKTNQPPSTGGWFVLFRHSSAGKPDAPHRDWRGKSLSF